MATSPWSAPRRLNRGSHSAAATGPGPRRRSRLLCLLHAGVVLVGRFEVGPTEGPERRYQKPQRKTEQRETDDNGNNDPPHGRPLQIDLWTHDTRRDGARGDFASRV